MAQMRVGNHIPLKFGIVVLTFVCLAAQAIGQRGASQNAEIDDGRQLYHAVIVRSCHTSSGCSTNARRGSGERFSRFSATWSV